MSSFGRLLRRKYAMGDADDFFAHAEYLTSNIELELLADFYDAACSQGPPPSAPSDGAATKVVTSARSWEPTRRPKR
jgi:hypothetical protein